MSEDWYIFKQSGTYNNKYEYLGYISNYYSSKEKEKFLLEEANKHKNCNIIAMKVVKGFQT